MQQALNLVLMFFYIFGFSFYRGQFLSSSLVVLAFLGINLIVDREYFRQWIALIRRRFVVNFLIVFLVSCLYILFILFANSSTDFSFLKTYFHMFLLVLTGFFLHSYYVRHNSQRDIINYIVYSFALQTTIQWVSFTIPEFKNLIDLTKNHATIIKGQSYSGVRANALSGSDFFGLSSAYAIFLLIFSSKENTIFSKNRILKLLFYVYITTGTFFAGRTGFIGVFIAVVYFICYFIPHYKEYSKVSLKTILTMLVVVVTAALTFFLVIDELVLSQSFANLFRFAFELFDSILKGEGGHISSLNRLNEMYIDIPIDTLLIGDGLYTVNYGYYKSTDIGFYRPILYGGVLLFLFLNVLQLMIIFCNAQKEKMLKLFIYTLLIILSFKGEVILWNQICVTIITIYSLIGSEKKYG